MSEKSKQFPEKIFLRVAEGGVRDVGRGIARLDPLIMKELKVEVGDIVSLYNERVKKAKPAVAKVMPSFTEERGKGLIQIDGLIRENASASLGEKIEIKKIKAETAKTIILSPLTAGDLTSEEDTYLNKLFAGIAVTKGDKIRATLFGTQSHDFLVLDTDPDQPVIIDISTNIKIKDAAKGKKRGVGVFYEDVGGLTREVQRIREMIELPLKYPEIFNRLGIEAPKGVLLYGPPGCGKTLIAKAIANETNAYFIHINGPEIVTKFYGESEARLRELFEEAKRNAPAIIFLDEIDSIAPKRAEVTGEVEKRIVAQLLALMDGLSDRGQVIVIGATNIPHSLDPALRRPGRFDREISISIPDKNGRKTILEIHTRGMPLTSDVSLQRLAEITHGFVGADMEALAREAAMAAVKKLMPEIEFEKDYIPSETLLKLEVTMDDFYEALKVVEPSALREVFTEIPNVKWEDVGGLTKVKQVLQQTIEWPLQHADLFKKANLTPSKGILLYGSPGCGKTLIAKAAASSCGVNFISVKGPALLSKYVGESEKGVREVFQKAKQASPCIIFFDELDSLVPKREESGDSHVSERVVSQFLTELDGIEELKGVVVLGATNRLDMIDPALLRAGRFDFLLEIAEPDEKDRLEILKIHLKNKPISSDINYEELVAWTANFTGSDIEMLCRKAAMLAIESFVKRKKFSNKLAEFQITTANLAEAIENIKETHGYPLSKSELKIEQFI